jgi:RND family efflux transporter MFP subunit
MNLAKIMETFKNPKARRYGLIALALAVIAVPVIRRKMAIAREKAPEAYPVALDLASPRLGVLRAQETFLGLFKPENQAALSSRLSARVVFIAEEGTAVKKGDVVLRLDTTDLAAGAEALNIKKQNQEKVYNRDKVLFDNGAVSQEQLENSQNLYQQAVSAYEAAAAQLSYGVVSAPFDAVVGKRYLQPGDTAFPGKVLLQLDGTGPGYEVYSDLPVETAAKIKTGSEQEIAFNGGVQRARVKAVVPAAANNLMTVKLALTGNKLNIPAGTYVDTHFYTSVSRGFIVPVNSVSRNMNGFFALTVKNGTVHWVPVKMLGTDGVNYCVEGLAADARLGTAPEQDLLKIYEGQKITAVRESGTND